MKTQEFNPKFAESEKMHIEASLGEWTPPHEDNQHNLFNQVTQIVRIMTEGTRREDLITHALRQVLEHLTKYSALPYYPTKRYVLRELS